MSISRSYPSCNFINNPLKDNVFFITWTNYFQKQGSDIKTQSPSEIWRKLFYYPKSALGRDFHAMNSNWTIWLGLEGSGKADAPFPSGLLTTKLACFSWVCCLVESIFLKLAYFIYFIGRLSWWLSPHLPRAVPHSLHVLLHWDTACESTGICSSPLLPGLWLTSSASHFQVVAGPMELTMCWGPNMPQGEQWTSALLWLLGVQCLLKTTNQ